VHSYWEKVAAERAATRVDGVKAVVNELEIQLPDSSERTNEHCTRWAAKGDSGFFLAYLPFAFKPTAIGVRRSGLQIAASALFERKPRVAETVV
jgi:hypothetical protein